jgi:hypothetical protein
MPFTLSTAGDLASISGSGAALNADLVTTVDTSNYQTALIQLTGTFNAVVTFQGSVEDNPTNWITLLSISAATGNVGTTANATGLYYVPLTCKWFRVRVTSYTSGTVNSTAVFSLEDIACIQNGGVLSSALATGSNNIGSIGAVSSPSNSYAASRITGAVASGVIKASAGRAYSWTLLNTNAAARFLQVYNKATAGVPGTDTPVFTIPLPASGAASFADQVGYYAAAGLSWAITTDAAGTTAGAATDIVGTLFYV